MCYASKRTKQCFYETFESPAVCIYKSNKNPKRMVFLRDLLMLKLNHILKTMLNKVLTSLYFNLSTSTATQTYSCPKYKLKFTWFTIKWNEMFLRWWKNNNYYLNIYSTDNNIFFKVIRFID